MVPCSRSRTIAAPASMIASIVTLLMIPITLVNHDVVTLGLNATRITSLTGEAFTGSVRPTKRAISACAICSI